MDPKALEQWHKDRSLANEKWTDEDGKIHLKNTILNFDVVWSFDRERGEVDRHSGPYVNTWKTNTWDSELWAAMERAKVERPMLFDVAPIPGMTDPEAFPPTFVSLAKDVIDLIQEEGPKDPKIVMPNVD
jgi:hypothetical protein